MTTTLNFQEPPTTIIFDLDGTLRESVPGGDQFMLEHAVALGLECPEDCFLTVRQWAHRYWANSECLMLDEKTYGRGERTFWENYARRTLQTIGAPPEQVEKLAPTLHQHMHENYRPEDTIPEDVIPTLKALRQAGLTIGLLTNRTHSPAEYLEEVGLSAHLDFAIAAGEVGVWKPSPEIFFYSLGAARARPQQTIYIGDNYYADVEGAENAGLIPVLIDREHIFPEATCTTIREIGELVGLLEISA